MQNLEPYWGRQALDFVDAIEASKTSACVISQFERMIGGLGFHAYIPTSGQSLRELTVANGWPAEWFELYNRENLSSVDIFPYLNIRGPIRRHDVYELSRIFVIPERRGEHAGPRVEMLLLTAIMEYGISIGLTGFTIVLESWWLPRFERCGWKARPLGLPQLIDGMSVLAVLVDCDDTTWKHLCSPIGLKQPTLTWRGLTGINRLALPDISTLPPASAQPAR